MSPQIVLKRELLPDPMAPIMQTNSPLFMVKLRDLRMNSYFSGAASTAASFTPSGVFSFLRGLNSSSFLLFLSFLDFFFSTFSSFFSKPQWKFEPSFISKAESPLSR